MWDLNPLPYDCEYNAIPQSHDVIQCAPQQGIQVNSIKLIQFSEPINSGVNKTQILIDNFITLHLPLWLNFFITRYFFVTNMTYGKLENARMTC